MKADPKIIEILNQVLKNELTAINQYFLHSRLYQNWGLEKLAKKEYDESIEEMKHADDIIQRILFLEGLPNLQELGLLSIGENVTEILRCDLALEEKAINDLKTGIPYCESAKDFSTRDLLVGILNNEEEHVDWLETQLDLIKRIGSENFCQAQM